MALLQFYAMRDAMRDALRGDSVIDLGFVASHKAVRTRVGAFMTMKRHNLQINH